MLIPILLFTIQLLDAITTHIGHTLGAYEKNPIMNFIIQKGGYPVFYLVKIAIGLLAAKYLSHNMFWVILLLVLYTFVLTNNLIVIYKLS